ncbi:N5-glutamine methyltransferase family protein [Rudaeicoccus suwonensis]|nr:class I SAM-dependent methyltransferase [Rudaeicoccus suwonensis]
MPDLRAGDELLSLREQLIAAGYTTDGVSELLGPVASAALRREQRLPADRVTAGPDSPLAILVRLFSLGLPVDRAAVDVALDVALDGWGTARLLDHGLVVASGDEVRAAYDLRPYADGSREWWVLSDLPESMTGRPLPVSHVLGIGGASRTLASWSLRRPVRRALDLGTGCGVQSLHLSAHAEQVVATDTSARALDIAAWNASINGVRWDLRRGSLFEPVAGERFDLIVSNPPFVITPRTPDVPTYEYRDGGAVGHTLVRDLIAALPDHLEPGGVAQMLANWEVPAGGDWRTVVGGWFAGTGLDAWVVQRDTQDPAQYAELWAGDGGHRSGTAGFEQMYAAWLADFESRDVAGVGFGVITVQRPSTDREPFRDFAEATGPVQSPMGPTVDAGLRARTWLAEVGDAGVLETRFRVAPDVTEERNGRPGAEDPSVIVIRQGGGLGRAVRVDTALAAYVSVCDGELTTAQALDAIATLLDVSPERLRTQALPTIRDLVADGLLIR